MLHFKSQYKDGGNRYFLKWEAIICFQLGWYRVISHVPIYYR